MRSMVSVNTRRVRGLHIRRPRDRFRRKRRRGRILGSLLVGRHREYRRGNGGYSCGRGV